MRISIAIDGPAGAGKSTVARGIADDLGIVYLDTGAMYRAVGLWMLRNSIDVRDEMSVVSHLNGFHLDFDCVDGDMVVCLDGEDVSRLIRTDDVSMAASCVSAFAPVRSRLVAIQQEIASGMSVVAEGRDIGQVVLPNATLKVYLDAIPMVRAQRRQSDLLKRGEKLDLVDVLKSIEERDKQDMTRSVSPLMRLPDALYIDSTFMSVDNVMSTIYWGVVEALVKAG